MRTTCCDVILLLAYLTTDPSKASELANEEERKIKEMFADWKDQIKNTGVSTDISLQIYSSLKGHFTHLRVSKGTVYTFTRL